MIVVAALYKFTRLEEPEELQRILGELTKRHGIKGTLIIATEGINGTVAGEAEAIEALKLLLFSDQRFMGIEYKESLADFNPFKRMKVKLKKEIVTLGRPEANPGEISGTYVNAKEWNQLLHDPDVIVLDVRNDYEVQIGSFKNAVNPKTNTFREFPDFVAKNLNPAIHKKIAMTCTGGIRCEKASSYMKTKGFAEVFHLKGGILQYLADTPKQDSQWQGECFVFDHRVAVDHDLNQGSFALCYGCTHPISAEDMLSSSYVKGVTCPKCVNTRTPKQKKSAGDRQQQIERAHG